ncbi:MAG: hypothetical protein BWK73_08580 [Thiothrix lacustris]|uniref:DOMON-like domain-containing protein n=1 Tax=Thiothrix lacustris TaxID=525917 RepID=A0A1Y1QVH0_9GAMM|nr:MAG: hypothetical protein BWK73_08580 [Thiothrix lacustris]
MLTLIPHPTTPCAAVESLQVSVAQTTDHWYLRYVLHGDLSQLRIPAPQPPHLTDGLWEHTCFEIFIGEISNNAYYELNFSPSGQWAVYAFSDYRQRTERCRVGQTPRMVTTQTAQQLCLDIHVAAATTPARIGVSAVIETAQGEKTYWALAHPSVRPDFHHGDGFTHAIGY